MLRVQAYQNLGNQNQKQRTNRNNISFMAIQQTVFGIKPDAYERKLARTVKKEMLQNTGLKVVASKVKVWSKTVMEAHYKEHSLKSFFVNLINYVTRGKFGVYVLEGEDAVLKARTEATNIRNRHAGSIPGENLVHTSDSERAARIEKANFFPRKYKLDMAA